MKIEEKAQAVLVAATSVTALVPAKHIRPTGDWQGLAAPYIIHYPVSESPTRCHGGLQGLEIYDFYQVSVYAKTLSAARAIQYAVRVALDGNHGGFNFQAIPGLVYVGRDDVLNLEHVAVNFRASTA